MIRRKKKSQENNSHLKIRECHYVQHNYLIYCNDVLVRWLHWIDEHKLCNITIKFRNEAEMKSFQKVANKDIMGWLKNNEYEAEMYEINRRHILCSLVADFCHYMFESFVCASKMKPAVAYALLRKPLRDNLAYIEWLRVNPKEMIDKLLYDEPEEYTLKKEQVKQHIEQICSQYGIDREKGMFIYRYEKNEAISLEKIWNKANHIVTTQNYTKSAQGELNFVFVNKDRWEELTTYYYMVIPQLMAYAVELVLSMFEEFAEVNEFTQSINKILLILHQACGMGDKFYQEGKKTLEVEKYPFICPYCGKSFVLVDENMDNLMNNTYKCKMCKHLIDASNYVFDYENEEMNQKIKEGNKTEKN